MADIEHELESCPTCQGMGTLKGERCPECLGRGVIRVPHAEVVLAEDVTQGEEGPALGSLKKADLVEIAERRGIDSSGTKAEIIARIQAADESGEEERTDG